MRTLSLLRYTLIVGSLFIATICQAAQIKAECLKRNISINQEKQICQYKYQEIGNESTNMSLSSSKLTFIVYEPQYIKIYKICIYICGLVIQNPYSISIFTSMQNIDGTIKLTQSPQHQAQINKESTCFNYQTQFLWAYQLKEDGRLPKLIIGLKLQSDKQNQAVQIQSSQSTFISQYLFIRIFCLFTILLILTLLYVCYERYSLRKNEQKNNKQIIQYLNEKFPPKKYAQTKIQSAVKDQDQCSICMVQLTANSMIRKMSCQHIFHQICIDEWCLNKPNCPICRFNFLLQLQEVNSENQGGNRSINWNNGHLRFEML